ncbi:AraC family transcriptional regulator [Elizabethkingia occulta]|uniref:AraC family transcriptional regulator n=1 Tax=Elizabethkingia occulta TaxID=1867263 RepID=UPI00099A35FB|nr:AraC family transcriptional regulator [Elizabethkingia occulta]OPB91433.1 hypothetical protein BB020_10555 [Elizabethkingia occulta]
MYYKTLIDNYSIPFVASEFGIKTITGIAINKSPDDVRKHLTKHPHFVDGFICAICIRGKARLRINFQEQELKPGTIMIILPDTMLEPLDISDDLYIDTLFFSYDLMSDESLINEFDTFQKIRLCPCIIPQKGTFEIFRDYHTFISKLFFRDNDPDKYKKIRYLILALVNEIKSVYISEQPSNKAYQKSESLANRFLQLLFVHHKQERSVNFYADKACLTPRYFTTEIRKSTGKPALTWINEVAIAHAKSLLVVQKRTVKEIAEELNFTDASMFCRFFKRHTGLTPSEYRQTIR